MRFSTTCLSTPSFVILLVKGVGKSNVESMRREARAPGSLGHGGQRSIPGTVSKRRQLPSALAGGRLGWLADWQAGRQAALARGACERRGAQRDPTTLAQRSASLRRAAPRPATPTVFAGPLADATPARSFFILTPFQLRKITHSCLPAKTLSNRVGTRDLGLTICVKLKGTGQIYTSNPY